MDLPNLREYTFSDDDIAEVIATELPDWKKACDSAGADNIMFHQDAFGASGKELLLMAMALKYAQGKRKNVTIVSKS